MTPSAKRFVLLSLLLVGCQPADAPDDSETPPPDAGGGEPAPEEEEPDAGAPSSPDAQPSSSPDAGVDPLPSSFTVGGAVDGLAGSGLVLRLQHTGGPTKVPIPVDLAIGQNGVFQFPAALADGVEYSVLVHEQQDDVFQGCVVRNGEGLVDGASVTDIVVHCQRHRLAFVTSAAGLGPLGSWPAAGGKTGLAAGDQICQTLGAGLGGTFVAWLSDDTNDAYCRVHGRAGKKSALCGMGALPISAGPWLRTDGVRFADAIDAALPPMNHVYASASVDEAGRPLAATTYFTGTGLDGARSTEAADTTCANWTSALVPNATAMGKTDVAAGWSFSSTALCKAPRHLLCLETGAGVPF
jgi:hypothetical protein